MSRMTTLLHRSTIGLFFVLGLLAAAFAAAQTPAPKRANAAQDSAAKLVPGRFVDITSKVGVKFLHQAPHTSRKYLIETMGSGVALFDCDNDGRLDIFLVNGAPYSDPTPKGFIPQKTGPEYWNRLYHQKADGTFEDITEKAGLQGVGYGMGVAVADYDNDGYEDLYVTAYGGNRLYHNNGNCTFTDVTDKAGVGGSGWSTSAAWVDLDNDGLLDLVVDRYVKWDWDDVWCGEHREGYRGYCHPDVFQPITMLVYHNDGDGHFTEVSHKLGLDKPAKALGIAIADYDHDGRVDIFVANDSMQEFLFHQKKDGTFEEVGLESGVAVNSEGQTYAGMGVDFADYNNDGWPDLVITDLANQRYALYENARDGTFNYVSLSTGFGEMTRLHSGWSLRFLDYDNDGWKDMLIAQGHDLDTIEKSFPLLHYREPMMLVRNTGKKFVDVSGISSDIFHDAWVGRGMAIGDIDNDGRIDAVVTTNGGPAYVLRNETETANHWITLRLIGHKSNRDAIGAEVKISTSLGDQWGTVTTSSGYLSASDPRLHFGLGSEKLVKRIEIRWPSGIKQELSSISGDRQLTIDEPAQSTNTASAKSSSIASTQMEFSDQPSFTIAGVTDWTAVGGHGADTILRTSEDLARETTALKPATISNTGGEKNSAAQQSADSHRLAGEFAERQSDALTAVREFEQAAHLDPSEQNYFEWGSELLLHRAIWQAVDVLQIGADKYPASVRMLTGLGAALFAGARYDQAALRLCQASDLNPSAPEPYTFMGKVEIAAPHPSPCIETKLARFVSMQPDNSIANYLYAMALLKSHKENDSANTATAKDFLSKATKNDAKCAEAYLQLGVLATQENNLQAGVDYYLKSIQANPDLGDAHYRLGVVYEHLGDPDKARREFELHDRIEKVQAQATEEQRKELKQFVLSPDPPASSKN